MLLGEVGKLREDRRSLQHELGFLMCMKAKYGPGGEFDPDWRPPAGPSGLDGPPAEPLKGPSEEPAPAKTAWRTVIPRKPRAHPWLEAGPGPGPDSRGQVMSWATWQPDPNMAPTPPSVELTLLVPDRGSPGLFGPRTPRDSYRE